MNIRPILNRMGVLVPAPSMKCNRLHLPHIEWSHPLLGVFFNMAPPNALITNVVNNHYILVVRFEFIERVIVIYLNIKIQGVVTQYSSIIPW